MSFFTETTCWCSSPQAPLAVFSKLMKIYQDQNIKFDPNEKIFFNSLPENKERKPEADSDGKSLSQCLELLAEWKGLGGLDFHHPEIRLPLFTFFVPTVHQTKRQTLHESSVPMVNYFRISVQHSIWTGDKDELILRTLGQLIFQEMEQIGIMIVETPSDNHFDPENHPTFNDALKTIHKLQLKTSSGSRDMQNCLIMTRSLPTTFDSPVE